MPGARPNLGDVRRGIRIAEKADIDVKKVVRTVRRARKIQRFLRKLPGLDVDIRPAPRGRRDFGTVGQTPTEYVGTAFSGDENLGRISKPRNTWLFALLTRPIEKAVNRALFEPKPWFKRKPGPGERRLDL